MEGTVLNKIKQLIHRFDQFERQPHDFIQVDSLVAEADRKLEQASIYTTPEIQSAANLLKQRKWALLYRLEKISAKKENRKDLIDQLLDLTATWIYTYQGFNPSTFEKKCSRKIELLVKLYPEVAELFVVDKKLREEFFKWALRDSNDITPFVLFPAEEERLKHCNLSQRIGYYHSIHLIIHRRLDHEGNVIKWLTLPFAGREIDISQEEEKVKLEDGKMRTVGEIFELFDNKRYRPGDLEFLHSGITYFPSYEPWKVMDLEQDEYYRTAPVMKIIKLEEAIERYGKTVPGLQFITCQLPKEQFIQRDGLIFYENDLMLLNRVKVIEDLGSQLKVSMRERIAVDGLNYINVIRATCEKPMSLLHNHAFADVLIPLHDGTYFLYSDGKYPEKYPESALQFFHDFARIVSAVLQVYDDNSWYNHRDHAEECIGLKPEEGKVLMKIKQELLKFSRDDKLGFEFQVEGCAKSQQVDVFKLLILLKNVEPEKIQSKMYDLLYSKELEDFDTESLPNFFRTSLHKVSPEGLLGTYYSFIKKLPRWLHKYMVTWSYLLFGAWVSKDIQLGERQVSLRHMDNRCWHDPENPYGHSLYHPAYLHEQQKEIGVTREKRKLEFLKEDLPIYSRLKELSFDAHKKELLVK